ncbi:MAG: metallophosphoesterase [Methylobacter sp.]|uniref:metallophosphoesterase n=1 Tax=Methylobacter sp. TaxID=2051955 RepID=UPI0025F67880|nr:metallophosphoesterase [Methylobacter sp.]MCK9619859.1 metallophosphoesterase [Methylobacter sp.]
MRINYFSDIHLEFGALEAPDNDADIIIAAGDIGVSTQGVEWLKTFNKPVVYIAGNHEFYTHEYQQTLQLIRKRCAGSNVHFLENDCFIFQGVRFLGCTLWADLFVEGDKTAEALGKTLNDFRRIKFAERPFDAVQFSQLHQNSKTWLEQELAQPYSGKTVVVTHHAPSLWSWNDTAYALKKLAYCNDMKPLLHEYEIAAWFHGHVHCQIDYRIAGARILCNPRGYAGTKVAPRFDQDRTVDI